MDWKEHYLYKIEDLCKEKSGYPILEWEIKRNGQGFDIYFGEYEENDLECIEHIKMKGIKKKRNSMYIGIKTLSV